jgi:hypothetical protein
MWRPFLNIQSRNCSSTKFRIIFSFWKKSLDLVGELFTANGIQYLRVDGSLSLGRRKTVLSEFQVNPEIRVLVMTLGTGAIGWVVSLTPVESVHFSEWSLLLRLNNLSIASRIYLLEPQWNPSVENQAIGRIFRLGQERPVTVVRYIVDKTIEDVSPEVILASVPWLNSSFRA